MEDIALSSTHRVIRILHALAGAGSTGARVSDLAQGTGVALATVHRMVSDLEREGLVYRTPDRLCFPNFSFSRQIEAASVPLAAARETARSLSLALGIASEIVFMRGQNLVWHAKFEPEYQSIQLRAHPGYVRTAYELDALSRLALAHLPLARIEAHWDLANFRETGVAGHRIPWERARAILEAVDPGRPEFDMQGNAKGVRRFAIALSAPPAEQACLLTLVEAAIPLRDPHRHQDEMLAALVRAREAIREQEEAAGATRGAMGGET